VRFKPLVEIETRDLRQSSETIQNFRRFQETDETDKNYIQDKALKLVISHIIIHKNDLESLWLNRLRQLIRKIRYCTTFPQQIRRIRRNFDVRKHYISNITNAKNIWRVSTRQN